MTSSAQIEPLESHGAGLAAGLALVGVSRHEVRTARAALARAAWACAALLCTSTARAQRCPEPPADWRPHVSATALETLVADERLWLSVEQRPQYCSYVRSSTVRANARAYRVTVIEGPSRRGAPLPIVARGERLGVTLPFAGSYTLRIESLTNPSLESAMVRAHRIDRSRSRSVRFDVERSPLDAERAPAPALIELWRAQTVMRIGARVTPRGWMTRVAALEPGTYAAILRLGDGLERRGSIVVPEGRDRAAIAVRWAGSSLSLDVDWLPADVSRCQVIVEPSDQKRATVDVVFGRNTLGSDLAPGPATLVLRCAPAREAEGEQGASEPWTEIYRERVTLAPQTAHSLRWSMPSLFARDTSAPRLWFELPSLADRPFVPRGDVARNWHALFVAGESVGVLANAVHLQIGRSWSSLEIPPRMFRGMADRWPVAARSADAFAWVDGAMTVSYRTRAGLSQERLPLYDPNRPYPCYTTGVALFGTNGLVAVGRCRANLPAWARDAAEEGFVAVRDANGWRLRAERFAPLSSATAVGERVIAVGARGTLVELSADYVRARAVLSRDLVLVRAGRSRIVALDDRGALHELSSDLQQSRVLAEYVEDARPWRVEDFCFVGDTLVALAREPASGLRSTADRRRLVSWRGDVAQAVQAIAQNPTGLACGPQHVYTLAVDEHGEHRLDRTQVESSSWVDRRP